MGDVPPISKKIVLAHLPPMVTRPPRDLGVLDIGRPAWILVVSARRFISAPPPSSFHSVSFLLFRILINAVFIQRSQSSLSSSPSTHTKPQQLFQSYTMQPILLLDNTSSVSTLSMPVSTAASAVGQPRPPTVTPRSWRWKRRFLHP